VAAQLLSDVVTRRGVESRTDSDTEFGVTGGERKDRLEEDGCCGVDELIIGVDECPTIAVIGHKQKQILML